MPELTLKTLALFSFPEAMVFAWLGLTLVGYRPDFYQIVCIGGLQTLFDAFFFLVVTKLISLPFGVHTITEMAVSAWIIQYVMRVPYKHSWLAVTFGYTVLASIEALMLPLAFLIRGQSLPVLNESNWLLHLPYFALELTIILIIIFLLRRFNVSFTARGLAETNETFLWLGGLLFTQTLLFIIMCYQYYAYQQPGGTVELPFVIGNAIVPVITLMIMWGYCRNLPPQYFRNKIKRF